MQNVGVIAEFNPFHLGHKHLFEAIKNNGDTIICVMSGNFVQRGDTAIIPKYERCRMAIENGADIVIELPTPWAMSNAENFALGAVSILSDSGIIDKICFGSECGDIDVLKNTAKLLKSHEFHYQISQNLNSGCSFPKVCSEILRKSHPDAAEIIKCPNNVLGIEYINAAEKLGFVTQFQTVSRIGAAHDSRLPSSTASASLIRQHLTNGDIDFAKKYMPEAAFDILKELDFSDISRLDTAILYSLRLNRTPDRFATLPDISEGLENRIADAVQTSQSFEQLCHNVKSKRYTLARIRRIILSAFLVIDNRFIGQKPPYIRILGFSQAGEYALKQIKSRCNIPVILTSADALSLQGFAKTVWETECRLSDIYSLTFKNPHICGKEYFHKIIKKEF